MSKIKNKIIKNAIIHFKNGENQFYDIIKITDQGVIYGNIKKEPLKKLKTNYSIDFIESNDLNDKFIEGGFIPKSNIIKISIGKNNFYLKEEKI